jgi:DNA-binding CsgD family transcriptional regulator
MSVISFSEGHRQLRRLLVGPVRPVAERVVFVTGGIGSGKTTLLYEFGRSAEDSGGIALSATATPDDFPFSVVEQLAESKGVSSDIRRRISELVHGKRVPDSAQELREPLNSAVIREISTLLLMISSQYPTVVEIDDLHHVDAGSAAVLVQLRRRLDTARMVLVGAGPDWLDPAVARPSDELARYPFTRLSLAPMTEEEIWELLASSAGAQASVHHAPAFHELSGGSPMLVDALIEDNRWAPGVEAVAGQAYGQAVLAGVRHAEPPALAVAHAVAVLDEDTTPELVGRLAGTTPALGGQLIAFLARSGLLHEGRFRDPAARTALHDSLPAEQWARLHVRAAELLHDRGAVAGAVARHLVAADEIAGSWSQAVLLEAADHALTAGDAGFATRCLVLAHRTGGDDEQHGAITSALVRAGWRVTPSGAAGHLTALKEAAAEGTLVVPDAVTLMRYSLWSGDAELLSKALHALSQSPDAIAPRVRAELCLAWQWSYGSAPPELTPRGTDEDPWARTVDTLLTVWTQGGSPAVTEAAETLLRSSRLADISLEMVATAILALLAGNRSDRADWWCRRLLETSVARGATTWQALLTAIRASVMLRRGELLAAAAQADAAFALLDPRGWGVLIGFPLGLVIRINTMLGRFDAAAEALLHPVPDAMFTTVGGLQYVHVRGLYHLAVDQVLAAISDLQQCRTLARRLDLDMPALIPWAADLALAHLRLGEADVARVLAKEQLDAYAPVDDRTRGLLLRVLAATSPQPERRALLEDAVDYLSGVGDPVELAGALDELGDVAGGFVPALGVLQDRVKQRDLDLTELAGMLSQVYQAFGEFGRMRALTRWQQEGVAPAAEGPPDLAPSWAQPDSTVQKLPALSEAERRVAELAALGHSNREIGSLLYVTVSTVEQHLTRVYRKLGIDGRPQLTADLFD